MNFTIIIAILVALKMLVPILAKLGHKKNPKIKADWDYNLKSAKLNQQLYENANDEEKEDIIVYFTQKIRQTDNYGKSSFENMPKTLQVVYLINGLEREVNNGGYLQFFTNSTGQYINETLQALKLIGAHHNKKLLKKAVKILKKYNESPENLNEKIKTKRLYETFNSSNFYENDKLINKMKKLDSEFFEYKENISKLKLEFFETGGKEFWNELKEKYGS